MSVAAPDPAASATAHELALSLEAMAAKLAERDAELKASLRRATALEREMHHRVGNNLQVVTSLLNLQQRAARDPAAVAALSDTGHRVGALALINRSLSRDPVVRRVDVRDFLQELVAELTELGIGHGDDADLGGVDDGGVDTEPAIDSLTLDPNELAPLALFAVEAIANARKCGFAPPDGVLRIGFHVTGSEAVLSIADEGTERAPAEFEEGAKGTLMAAFARQLGGDLSFETNRQGGVTTRMIFPTPEPSAAPVPPAALF
jgi:two-component sensor histidine kinase